MQSPGWAGIFNPTLFTRQVTVAASVFLRPMHPKTTILPRPDAIQRILAQGWVAQLKIHGHRAQVHVPAKESQPILIYNRQGNLHRKAVSEEMDSELRRLFTPDKGWNVLDAEWLKDEDRLFVFDFVKKDGVLLRTLAFPERFKLLPRNFISPRLSVLPLIPDLAGCLKALASPEPHIEGIVLKSKRTPGFSDTSIIRCRKA